MATVPSEDQREGKGGSVFTDQELADACRWGAAEVAMLRDLAGKKGRGVTRGAFARLKALELLARYGHARPKGTVDKGVIKAPAAYVLEPPPGKRISRVTINPDGQAVAELEDVEPAEAEAEAKAGEGESPER